MGHFKEIAALNYSRLSHKRDPITSKVAAKAVVKSGKLTDELKMIHDALKAYHVSQAWKGDKKYPTARELSVISGIDYFLIQKRLSVIDEKGFAVRRPARVCEASGTGLKAVTWEAIYL